MGRGSAAAVAILDKEIRAICHDAGLRYEAVDALAADFAAGVPRLRHLSSPVLEALSHLLSVRERLLDQYP